MQERIPIFLFTGFLGSGKTTLINRLLGDPAMASSLVLVNEFGEIGVDQDLLSDAAGDMVLLQSGCLCCTIRGELTDTLRATFMRQEFLRRLGNTTGLINRILIETTGLADPVPVLQSLLSDPYIVQHSTIRSVIATADAVHAVSTLDGYSEAVRQVAVADTILLTKVDIAGATDIQRAIHRITALNSIAKIIPSNGNIPIARLLEDILFMGAAPMVARRVPSSSERLVSVAAADDHDGKHKTHAHSHDDNFAAATRRLDISLQKSQLDAWMAHLIGQFGSRLLRGKGIVFLEGEADPFVINIAQGVLHPPVQLQDRSGDRTSRLVLIGEAQDLLLLEKTLALLDPTGD